MLHVPAGHTQACLVENKFSRLTSLSAPPLSSEELYDLDPSWLLEPSKGRADAEDLRSLGACLAMPPSVEGPERSQAEEEQAALRQKRASAASVAR